jgi:glucose-6-phosphate isomerase
VRAACEIQRRAQDALAFGKTEEQCRAEGIPEELVAHKVFGGDRPSVQLLLPELSAFSVGQLLSIYETRTVVLGFLLGVNSFDQWGVELGKVLLRSARESTSAQVRKCPNTELPEHRVWLCVRCSRSSAAA